MISVADYLDNDVSYLLGKFVDTKKQYNKVILELHKLIDFNLHLRYVKSFDCIPHPITPTVQLNIIRLTKNILQEEELWSRRRSLRTSSRTFMHNWPSVPPSSVIHRNEDPLYPIQKAHGDNYYIPFKDGRPWKIKQYPPNKEYYPLESLQLVKLE